MRGPNSESPERNYSASQFMLVCKCLQKKNFKYEVLNHLYLGPNFGVFLFFFWGGDCLRVLPVAFLNFLSSANHGGQHFYSAPSPPQKNNFLLRNIRVMTPPPNTPKFLLQFLTKITITSLCPSPTHTHTSQVLHNYRMAP